MKNTQIQHEGKAMFETIESYEADKAKNRRATDAIPQTPCNIQAQRIDEFEKSLNVVSSTMQEISKSMQSIAKGISNTVDSHRDEMNELAIRISNVEHLSEGMEAQRKVLLSVAAIALGLIVIGFYYFTNINVSIQKQLKVIELKVGVVK